MIFLILIMINVPWFYTEGSYEPIILGFPYWAFVSLLSAAGISAWLVYMMTRLWDMEDLEEEYDDEYNPDN